jgi:hypothetical protein
MEVTLMADLNKLAEEFAADFEAGRESDPAKLLAQVPAEQRQELVELLDSYLMQAPRRQWDPTAYRGSLAQLSVDRVYESVEGVSGRWPELLPRLRMRAKIKRQELVERLAGALGFGSEPEIEKVGGYYHRMEHGLLPAEGVSSTVIDAIAAIFGVSADAIRSAGSSVGGEIPGSAGMFARTASLDPDYLVEEDLDASPPASAAPHSPGPPAAHDEIDALFLDG